MFHLCHYSGVIMSAMASQITSLTIVYSIVYSGADQRKHQISASLAFVRGIHLWPVNYPHKGPVTGKMFPFDDVIMCTVYIIPVSVNGHIIHIVCTIDSSYINGDIKGVSPAPDRYFVILAFTKLSLGFQYAKWFWMSVQNNIAMGRAYYPLLGVFPIGLLVQNGKDRGRFV